MSEQVRVPAQRIYCPGCGSPGPAGALACGACGANLRGVAGPIAISWRILVAVFTAGVMVYRRMAISRQKMFER